MPIGKRIAMITVGIIVVIFMTPFLFQFANTVLTGNNAIIMILVILVPFIMVGLLITRSGNDKEDVSVPLNNISVNRRQTSPSINRLIG